MTYFAFIQYKITVGIDVSYRFRYNFIKTIMKGENPEVSLSFVKQNKDMNRQETRLNIQILRVHTIDKRRTVANIWEINQSQLCQFFTKYELFPLDQQLFRMEDLMGSTKLKLIKNQGKIYFGMIDQKKREGNGISLRKDGKIFQGEFRDNQKNGEGVEIYPNGNLYIGQFVNNKKHGQGRFFWFNLSSRNPKSDEYVQYYEGHWWGGLPDGLGTHQKINGDIYTGVFKNGLKHGQGTEFYANGDYYKGQFINGMPEGYGEYKWEDGSYFKGDFKQGLRNGYGMWRASKNRIQSYKGHYTMDKKSGHGIYTWDNGWFYKGNFQNDYRNGYGELYESDKKINYRGFWQNGEQSQNNTILSTTEKQISNNYRPNSRYSSKLSYNHDKFDLLQKKSKAGSRTGINASRQREYLALSNGIIFKQGVKKLQSSGNRNVKRASTAGMSGSNQKSNDDTRTRSSLKGTLVQNLFVPFRTGSIKKG